MPRKNVAKCCNCGKVKQVIHSFTSTKRYGGYGEYAGTSRSVTKITHWCADCVAESDARHRAEYDKNIEEAKELGMDTSTFFPYQPPRWDGN